MPIVPLYATARHAALLQNGFTALIRAIVFYQLRAAEILITERPVLKQIPDNVSARTCTCTQNMPTNTLADVCRKRCSARITHDKTATYMYIFTLTSVCFARMRLTGVSCYF